MVVVFLFVFLALLVRRVLAAGRLRAVYFLLFVLKPFDLKPGVLVLIFSSIIIIAVFDNSLKTIGNTGYF